MLRSIRDTQSNRIPHTHKRQQSMSRIEHRERERKQIGPKEKEELTEVESDIPTFGDRTSLPVQFIECVDMDQVGEKDFKTGIDFFLCSVIPLVFCCPGPGQFLPD